MLKMKIINRTKIIGIFHSLRMQLILYYMIISLVVLAVGNYFCYIYMMDILKKNNERYLLQQFSQADFNISSVLNEVDRLTKLFLLDSDVQQFVRNNYYTTEFNLVEIQNSLLKRISHYISNYNYLCSIYIFTENKGGIGGNDKYTRIIRDNEGNDSFFSSGMYEKVKESFPEIILNGGITEDFYKNNKTGGKIFVISAERCVKPTYELSRSAVFVFNINERYIASIYTNPNSFRDGYIHIIDENGKIISSSDSKNIGNAYQMFSVIDGKKDYGSFIAKNAGSPVQGVYYKFKYKSWYLVGEMPLQLITNDINILQRILIIIFTLSFFAILIVSFFWLRKVTEPLNVIAGKMCDVSRGNLGLTFSKIPRNEFGIVVGRFNEMSLSIVDLIKKNDKIQEEKRELEIESLQYQINPHFLFNTLNMIKWMAAAIKAKNIVNSIVALGNILKSVFETTDPMCILEEELEYLENYIKITNWRFSKSVDFKCNIEDHLLGCKIPRFILQPIIENSIIHGMQKQRNLISINIDITQNGNIMQIVISDTGVGIKPEKLEEINSNLAETENKTQRRSGGSIGIYNVNRRIRLNFGDGYGIRLENSEVNGTRVIIKIPMIH